MELTGEADLLLYATAPEDALAGPAERVRHLQRQVHLGRGERYSPIGTDW